MRVHGHQRRFGVRDMYVSVDFDGRIPVVDELFDGVSSEAGEIRGLREAEMALNLEFLAAEYLTKSTN